MIKILETTRLILRKFEDKDYIDCFEFLSDLETCLSDGGYLPFAEMNEDYKKLMRKFAMDAGRWMIYSKEHQKVIGTIHVMDAEESLNTKELGYVISPNYRRKGYAYEALHCLLHELLKDKSITLVVGVMEDNTASINLIHKLGFIYKEKKEEGINHVVKGKIPVLYYVMN